MSKKVIKDKKLVRLAPDVPVGTRCLILRPNILWSGLYCIVEQVSPEGLHRVRIQGKNGHTFGAVIMAHELRAEAASFKSILGL